MTESLHHVLATGQNECHDTDGNRVDCAGSGQDAETTAGMVWPVPRFLPTADLVKDRMTDLVWPRDANLNDFPVTWSEALMLVDQMNRGSLFGHRDWRLPSRRELRSLLSYQQTRPPLPEQHPFENVFQNWYWTSTTVAGAPAHAWYMHLGGGRMFYGGKDQSFMCWPVRGTSGVLAATTGQQIRDGSVGGQLAGPRGVRNGQVRHAACWPQPRFDTVDDFVRDNLTGLHWFGDANLTRRAVSWQQALDCVAGLGQGWRLPNINELESLVDAARFSPALPEGHPFKQVADAYWSSTTSMYEPDWAWALYLEHGALGVGQKRGEWFHVWPVRSTVRRP